MSNLASEGSTSAITTYDVTPTTDIAPEVTSHETTTLAGREEVIGRTYPSWLEKLVFVSSVVGAIWLGMCIWQSSDWHVAGKWSAIICGLPILVLFTTEAFGRIIQSKVTEDRD
jgi:hypothetical protein